MGRNPKAEEEIRKTKEKNALKRETERARTRVEAEGIREKCLVLGQNGDLKGASKQLYDGAKRLLTGKRQGEAGKADLTMAACKLLSLCVTRQIPPPIRLLEAFELILKVTPDDAGNDWDRVALAATYPSVNDVPVAELAAAAPGKHSKTPMNRRDAARLKKDSKFRKRVADAKAAVSPEGRKREDTARVRSKNQADHFEGLLNVVTKAYREPERAKPERQSRIYVKGYSTVPILTDAIPISSPETNVAKDEADGADATGTT